MVEATPLIDFTFVFVLSLTHTVFPAQLPLVLLLGGFLVI